MRETSWSRGSLQKGLSCNFRYYKTLAIAGVFCYDKGVFRAGCNSRPAVTLKWKCSFPFILCCQALPNYKLCLQLGASSKRKISISSSLKKSASVSWCGAIPQPTVQSGWEKTREEQTCSYWRLTWWKCSWFYKKSVFELFSYSILTSFVKYRGTF